MAKLQEIVRANGSIVNHVNLPRDIVEEVGFVKGDELEVKAIGPGKIELTKGEYHGKIVE